MPIVKGLALTQATMLIVRSPESNALVLNFTGIQYLLIELCAAEYKLFSSVFMVLMLPDLLSNKFTTGN
jgi:hypothetical protein